MSTAINLIELRAGGAADLPVIDTIMQQAFDPRYGEAWTRGQCLGILAMAGVWLTIATIDGAPAGFALARATGSEAELLLLATLPSMRRCGVGGALLRSVLTDARDRDVSAIYLEVRSGNEAIQLYRAMGFNKVGERKGYYRGKNAQLFDAFTYRLSLA